MNSPNSLFNCQRPLRTDVRTAFLLTNPGGGQPPPHPVALGVRHGRSGVLRAPPGLVNMFFRFTEKKSLPRLSTSNH
jgi:hypothetical protein